MEEKEKVYELEKTAAINNLQIATLTGSLMELTSSVRNLHDAMAENRGTTKLITWSIVPLLAALTGMGGYLMTQYDKTNTDQYARINHIEQKTTDIETRLVRLELTREHNRP